MSGYPPVDNYPTPPPQLPGTFDTFGRPAWQEPRRGNGMAVAALALGIIALFGFWTVVGGILFGLPAVILFGLAAVVFGLIAFIRARQGSASGGVMAMIGLVLGMLSLIGAVVALVLTVNVYNNTGGREFSECLNRAGSDQSAAQKCQDNWYQHIEDRYGVSLN